MKKRIMLVLLTTLLVFTLVGPPVFAKDPDKGAQGVPFQELQDALDEAVSTLQGQIDEVVSDLDQLVGDIDSIVQGKVDEAIAALSIHWSQITGVPADLTDGDDVGITSETDPTVAPSVKDGVSWDEISGIPAGFADDIDDVGMGSETDPIFSASDASGITSGDIANWDTAYSWGDHSLAGYLTGEIDPTVLASVKDGVDWSELSGIPAGFADGVDDIGSAGTAPSLNPLQVALLRWYEANETGNFIYVGYDPWDICFDGANIWMTNPIIDCVTKLKASDGSIVGTYPVGADPRGICFDGANIWVTNNLDDTVTKLRAKNGSTIGTYPVGGEPRGICFDGANIWVTNNKDDRVTKLKASDGSIVGTYPVGGEPRGICFDGANIWVVNNLDDTVTKLRAKNGSTVGTYPVGGEPRGICFDGANIWVANNGDRTYTKL